MRWIGIALLLVGCEFSTTVATTPDGRPIDAPDAPPEVMRTKAGLCAYWTFNEPANSVFALDTSASTPAVQLELLNAPGNNIFPAMFENGDLVAGMPSRVVSAESTRLADCAMSGAITMELWVRASSTVQGTVAEPVFVAGLTGNIGDRNIALLQGSTKWVALIRNSAANPSGAPAIVADTDVAPNAMNHIAIVASATKRTLYVNNAPTTVGTPSAVTGWNTTHPMVLFDEYQHARQFTGRIAMVALFNRELTETEIQTHWILGSSAQ